MTTLEEAIEQKFEMLSEPTTDLQHVRLYSASSASGSLCIPPVLVMDNSGVSTIGDLDRLARMCSHVTELDLCNNRLDNWPSLLELLGRLPRLRWLNLSINPVLAAPEPLMQEALPSLPQLTTLVLNQVPITWPLLASLLSAAPSVSELYLCNNSSTLGQPDHSHPDGGFPSIRQLYYNGNRLEPEDWSRLSIWFPQLEKLNLIGSAIQVLPDGPELLTGLKSLNLSENNISEWSELEKLNAFPGLGDLRVLDVALSKGRAKGEFRSEAVARLPHITQLNGTPISGEERTTAERAFLRSYSSLEATSPYSDRPSERLAALEAKHGRLDQLAKINLKPADTVNLVLRYGSQSRTYAVPTNQTVREVKRLVCAQFHIDPSKITMRYIDQGMVGAYGPEPMTLLGRGFHSYRPEDGDELVLEDRS